MGRITMPDLQDLKRRWDTLNWLCVALVHLARLPRNGWTPKQEDCKPNPSGHWGTCPNMNCLLAALSSFEAEARPSFVCGPGHAGVSLLAYSWASGKLRRLRRKYIRGREGLSRLCLDFPECDGLGSEWHPALGDTKYLGGQLGPALPFAQGLTLGQARPVVVAVGDGEAETGEVNAAWLADRTLRARRKAPLIVVLFLNGQRMGGRSILATMPLQEISSWLGSLGWQVESASSPAETAMKIEGALQRLETVILLTMPKGLGMPRTPWEQTIHDPGVPHKTPLINPRHDESEFDTLRTWLDSYEPRLLFNRSWIPRYWPEESTRLSIECSEPRPGAVVRARDVGGITTIQEALEHGLSAWREPNAPLVFSPDELSSNGLSDLGHLAIEVLNEQLCFHWAQGVVESGQAALVVSYEGFAPLIHAGITSFLKARRLIRRESPARQKPLVVILTSLGWKNVFSHGDPGLVPALLDWPETEVSVFYPSSQASLAALLASASGADGGLWVLTVDKHLRDLLWPKYPVAIEDEFEKGWVVHPLRSEGEVVLLSLGDLAGRWCNEAARALWSEGTKVRQVYLCDPRQLGQAIGDRNLPVVAITSASRSVLLRSMKLSSSVTIRGWVDGVVPQELPRVAGVDSASIVQAVRESVKSR